VTALRLSIYKQLLIESLISSFVAGTYFAKRDKYQILRALTKDKNIHDINSHTHKIYIIKKI